MRKLSVLVVAVTLSVLGGSFGISSQAHAQYYGYGMMGGYYGPGMMYGFGSSYGHPYDRYHHRYRSYRRDYYGDGMMGPGWHGGYGH